MAAWDLADGTLEFHDENCVGCAHWKTVRLPQPFGRTVPATSRPRRMILTATVSLP